MFSKPPKYPTSDIAQYVRAISVMSEERSKRQVDLRQYQNVTSQQKLTWNREIEDYNRDIASMQHVLDVMLKRVKKEQQE